MKVLVDMNLSPRWVDALVGCGLEAAHWRDLGAVDASDSEIMDFARARGFVILTHDLDFSTILAATRDAAPSVVQLRADDVSVEAIASRVIAALRQMSAELDRGALVAIDVARVRVRVLPLIRDN